MLPVEMLWMEASCNNNTPTLSWATATERNSSHFLIERSSDATSWDIVGRITSAGNSQQVIEYAWRDPAPLHYPTVYYRLRQVDLDGREDVYAVLPLESCGSTVADLTALPNPTDGAVEARWSQAGKGSITELRLMDAQGRVLSTHRTHTDANRMMLDLSAVAAGAYTLIGVEASGARISSARVVRR
ncbi:MAG: T9SS type A sorting domain-containing protein [Flavobacteriales bacterium]|nr:T9SS type A sorting domain-containing protein [Flavobacteriales bacterium]